MSISSLFSLALLQKSRSDGSLILGWFPGPKAVHHSHLDYNLIYTLTKGEKKGRKRVLVFQKSSSKKTSFFSLNNLTFFRLFFVNLSSCVVIFHGTRICFKHITQILDALHFGKGFIRPLKVVRVLLVPLWTIAKINSEILASPIVIFVLQQLKGYTFGYWGRTSLGFVGRSELKMLTSHVACDSPVRLHIFRCWRLLNSER